MNCGTLVLYFGMFEIYIWSGVNAFFFNFLPYTSLILNAIAFPLYDSSHILQYLDG